jgi:ABC-type multidrug transport system permease subunit
MRSLLSIISRNLKIISRSKLSFLLIVFAPILVVFLVGTAFNSDSLSNINVGVYSLEYSELTEEIITLIEDNQFRVIRMDNEDLCINQVKQGGIHSCIVFPPNLSFEGNTNPVVIHIDNSRVNLAYVLINQIDSMISSKSSEIGVSMADDLLKAVAETRTSLPNQKANIETTISSLDRISVQTSDLDDKSDDAEKAQKNSITNLETALSDLAKLKEKVGSLEGGSSAESDISTIHANILVIKNSLSASGVDFDDELRVISSSVSSGKVSAKSASEDIDRLMANISSIISSDAESVVMPIKTEVSAVGKESSNWKNLFPTLLALVVLLSSIVLSSSLAITERRAKARFRNFMTPTSDLSFILGSYITSFLIISVQLVLFFVVAFYMTGLNVVGILPLVVLVLFLSISAFSFMGLFLGYLFKSDETSILGSISLASILIVFSNTIIPIETITGHLKYLALYNPLFITDSLLKKIILFGEPINSLVVELLMLTAVLFVFITLSILSRKLTKRWA